MPPIVDGDYQNNISPEEEDEELDVDEVITSEEVADLLEDGEDLETAQGDDDDDEDDNPPSDVVRYNDNAMQPEEDDMNCAPELDRVRSGQQECSRPTIISYRTRS